MTAREDLVTAAADLLWERGYSATSPAMILKRSGAGQGSMYHHFAGKSDLARTAMERVASEMRRTVEAADDPTRPAVARVKIFLNLERDPLRGCRMGRLVQDPEVVDDDTLREAVASFFDWVERWLTEILEQGRAAGELAPDVDTGDIAAMVVAVVQGGYVLARAHGEDRCHHAAVAGAAAVLDGLDRSGR